MPGFIEGKLLASQMSQPAVKSGLSFVEEKMDARKVLVDPYGPNIWIREGPKINFAHFPLHFFGYT